MEKRIYWFTLLVFASGVLSSCAAGNPEPKENIGLPNPASVYCEENGGRLDLRADADGGVRGICVFPDGSECEEWAYFRGECAPGGQGAQEPVNQPTEIPTALPFNEADYQDWRAYNNSDYGFSLMLPEDWVAEEVTSSDPLMNGHFLSLHPRIETQSEMNVRVSFRRTGEETLLWPTGVGAGEFVEQGTLQTEGFSARRILFVCPGGQINEVWYHGGDEGVPNILIGEMEFGFIAAYSGVYCQEGYSLDGKTRRLADMIVSSLRLD